MEPPETCQRGLRFLIEVSPQSWARMRDAVQTVKHQLSQDTKAISIVMPPQKPLSPASRFAHY